MVDAKGLKLALSDFADKANASSIAFVREVALQAFTGVVMASPVGNSTRWARNIERAAKGKPPLPKGYVGGHFRKNWRLAVNSKPAGIVAGEDKSGQATIDEAMRTLLGGPAAIADYQAVVITNNLPYAVRLEDGYSKQAPTGMVAQTKAAIEARYGRGNRR